MVPGAIGEATEVSSARTHRTSNFLSRVDEYRHDTGVAFVLIVLLLVVVALLALVLNVDRVAVGEDDVYEYISCLASCFETFERRRLPVARRTRAGLSPGAASMSLLA